MYNKLFTKILDSSIWLAPDPHRLVWITLLAAMDEDGNAMFASAKNLAVRARVGLEAAQSAISAFESPDPDSGDPDNEGRRIERFPGGWHVLNAHKYRDLVTKAIARERTRERVAKHRASKAECNAHVTPRNAPVTPSESEAISVSRSTKSKTPAAQSQFDEIRKEYPKRGGGQRWGDAEKGYLKALANGSTHEDVLQGVRRYADFIRAKGDEGSEYVQQAGTFFGNNQGWREQWTPPTVKRELSPIERVQLANGIGAKDERVVSEQSGRSGESVGDIFGDVWRAPNAGLRRIGS